MYLREVSKGCQRCKIKNKIKRRQGGWERGRKKTKKTQLVNGANAIVTVYDVALVEQSVFHGHCIKLYT